MGYRCQASLGGQFYEAERSQPPAHEHRRLMKHGVRRASGWGAGFGCTFTSAPVAREFELCVLPVLGARVGGPRA